MTRKDYVALEEALAGEFPVGSHELALRIADWRGIVAAIANMCARENPKGFDRARFIAACEGN